MIREREVRMKEGTRKGVYILAAFTFNDSLVIHDSCFSQCQKSTATVVYTGVFGYSSNRFYFFLLKIKLSHSTSERLIIRCFIGTLKGETTDLGDLMFLHT